MIRKIFPLLLLFFTTSSVFSTHFIGLEARYSYLGQNQYRFDIGAYMDCSGQATSLWLPVGGTPSSLNLNIDFTHPGGSFCEPSEVQTGWQVTNYFEVTPLCPIFNTSCSIVGSPYRGRIYVEAYKDFSIVCPSSGSYQYTISECCLTHTNSSLQSTNLYVAGEFYPNAQNSSPIFPATQNFTFCLDSTTTFDLSVSDTSASYIRYELITVYDSLDQNGGLLPATYNQGYSPSSPLGPSYSVSIDSLSGVLTVSPIGSNAGIENGFIGIKTTEYNLGGLPEWTVAYYGLSSIDCNLYGGNSPPTFGKIVAESGGFVGLSSVQYCPGKLLVLKYSASDPNPLEEVELIPDLQSLPGATFVSFPGPTPIIRIYWTPSITETDSFSIPFLAFDNHCFAPDTVYSTIHLSKFQRGDIQPVIDSAICGDNSGVATLYLTKKVGPVIFTWPDSTTGYIKANLYSGTYPVTIFDQGCGIFWSDTVVIPEKNLVLQKSITNVSCFGGDGEISIQAIGGEPPYTYLWNNGSNNPTITGLAPGGYQVVAYDKNICGASAAVLLKRDTSCTVNLSGVTYLDLNENCVWDSSEPPATYIPLTLSDGQQKASSINGTFFFQSDSSSLSPSNGLTLSLAPSQAWGPSCNDSSWTYTFGSNNTAVSGIEIPIKLTKLADLSVDLVTTSFFAATATSTIFIHANNNTMDTTSQVEVVASFPSGIVITDINPSPDSFNNATGEIFWHVGSLGPGETQTLWYKLNTGAFPAGHSLSFQADIFPLINDQTPSNNRDSATRVVAAPYDPNDKQVFPKGIGKKGYFIPDDPSLEYTIRFQNTGNFPATYVFLRDTLDPHLSFDNYRHIGSSHPYTVKLIKDSIMVFTFENINLPDSASDPSGSIGHVRFSLGLDSLAPVGTTIANQAGIFFDFNPPIFTNATQNTIYGKPTAQIWYPVSDPDTLCVGDSLYGTISGGVPPYSWEWSTGEKMTSSDQTVFIKIPNAAPDSIISLTISDSLDYIVSDSLLVPAGKSPAALYSYPAQTTPLQIFFQNESLFGQEFLWDFGDGTASTEENPIHTFPFWGTYEVTLTVTNPCGDSSYSSYVDVLATDVDQELAPAVITVRFDPNEDKILVINHGFISPEVQLLDIHGRELISPLRDWGDEIRIDTQKLSSGLYTVSVRSAQGRYMKKILVRH